MTHSKKLHQHMLIFGVLIAHLPLVLLPSVNQEFVFADAARYFANHNQALLDQYFAYQANTLGIPWLGWLMSNAFPTMNMLTVIRLLSVSGILLLGVGFLRISHYLREQVDIRLLAILFLNPLIWTYSGRGTADFFPAAIGIFAISLALGADKRAYRILAAGVLLGLASILKYHELCLSLFLFALLWGKRHDRWSGITSVLVTSIALILLFFYVVQMHALFGFWITPERFQAVHGINLSNVASNFVAYAGYLVMLTAPISLILPGARRFLLHHWKLIIPIVPLLFLAGVYGLQNNGEMNLGPLDRWVSKSALSGIFLLLSIACMAPILVPATEEPGMHQFRKTLWLAVLIVMLVFSISRPAQRYLLPVLPFFLLIFPRSVFRFRVLILVTIIVLASLDAFIGYSQWCTGAAADKMVRAIERAGYITVTDPGAVDSHVGNRFHHTNHSITRFVVVAGEVNGAIISVRKGFSFAQKSFSLVPVEPSQQKMGRQ